MANAVSFNFFLKKNIIAKNLNRRIEVPQVKEENISI